MTKNINSSDDCANGISPRADVAHSQQSAQPYTPRPRPPRPSQASKSSNYPVELSAQPHHPHQHRYEGFEELLREAGYKETRIFTPERERVASKNEAVEGGNNDAKRIVRNGETTKLRSVVGFLAGFLVSSSNSERREEFTEHGPNVNTHFNPIRSPSSPPAKLLSTGSSSQSVAASSPIGDDIHTPTQNRSNFAYLQSNASYSSIGSTSTTTQLKYLRSAHIQLKRRQSGGVHPTLPGSHETKQSTSNVRQSQFSEMVSHPRPVSRNQGYPDLITNSPHLRPTQTESLPVAQSTVQHPAPSRAHAYLRHMASVQKIFDSSGSQATSKVDNAEPWTRADDREDGEDTPRPKFPRPRSIPHPSPVISPQTFSGLCNGLVNSPEPHPEDEGSEPDEENGGYFNLIRSRSQSRTRREIVLRGNPRIRAARTVECGEEENPGVRWWGLRQTRSMVHVKVHEEDEGPTGVEVKRRKSAIGVSDLGHKPMAESTDLVVPTLSRTGSLSPALPYLVTRLSSPVPPATAEHSRGRVQEKKTRVYCRSQSVPRRQKSGRGRWGVKESCDHEPVPILVANTSDSESIDGHDHDEPMSSSSTRYLSGWGMNSDPTLSSLPLPSEGSQTSTTNTHRSPPPRQNSIRSLRRHLKLDADKDQTGEEVPPVPVLVAGSGRNKHRGGLPGEWHCN